MRRKCFIKTKRKKLTSNRFRRIQQIRKRKLHSQRQRVGFMMFGVGY